jgi:hypothetical protein
MRPPSELTPTQALAQGLLQAVLARDFASTPDARLGGAPVAHFPSIDLAVIALPEGREPFWANVLFSREHPQGVIADIDGSAGPVRNIRFDADLLNAKGDSIAWALDADWRQLPLRTLYGQGTRMVAPYPASLLKLMVAVGVGMALDWELIPDWPVAVEPMLVLSDNDATTELVALLHEVKLVDTLNARLASLRLPTLQLNGTLPDGGWRNADGAGVGQIHMTAWDTARLLWLLDAEAPPAPWLPPGTRLLKPATRDHLRGVLQRQQLDHVLSSRSLRDVPGWVPGLPDAPVFAHKTGFTENYTANAGIVRGPGCHYIVALLSNLGRRYAPDPRCATTWRVPALGAAVHALLQALTAPRAADDAAP